MDLVQRAHFLEIVLKPVDEPAHLDRNEAVGRVDRVDRVRWVLPFGQDQLQLTGSKVGLDQPAICNRNSEPCKRSLAQGGRIVDDHRRIDLDRQLFSERADERHPVARRYVFVEQIFMFPIIDWFVLKIQRIKEVVLVGILKN